MSVFKRRAYACQTCGNTAEAFAWDYDAPPSCETHGAMLEAGYSAAQAPAVVDDTFTPHWCETLDHRPVWVESRSQLKREAEKRGLVNVVRKDDAYYAQQRKRHDEELRDTGRNVEY